MRPGIEAIQHRLVVVMRLAQIAVAEAAGHDVVFEHLHLEAGFGEQRGGGEAADAGADHRDVAVEARTRGERRRRPMVVLARGPQALDRLADGEARTEDRHQRARDDDGRRDPGRHAGPAAQAEHEEEHAPEPRHQHVDQMELRCRCALGISGAGIVRGPGTTDQKRDEADHPEPGKGEPQPVRGRRIRREVVGDRQHHEQRQASELKHRELGPGGAPEIGRERQPQRRPHRPAWLVPGQQDPENDKGQQRQLDREEYLHTSLLRAPTAPFIFPSSR